MIAKIATITPLPDMNIGREETKTIVLKRSTNTKGATPNANLQSGLFSLSLPILAAKNKVKEVHLRDMKLMVMQVSWLGPAVQSKDFNWYLKYPQFCKSFPLNTHL